MKLEWMNEWMGSCEWMGTISISMSSNFLITKTPISTWYYNNIAKLLRWPSIFISNHRREWLSWKLFLFLDAICRKSNHLTGIVYIYSVPDIISHLQACQLMDLCECINIRMIHQGLRLVRPLDGLQWITMNMSWLSKLHYTESR